MRLFILVLLGLALLSQAGVAASPGGCLLAIDIGHYRQASGAKSARGRTEWSFNAKLATLLYQTATAKGLKAILMNPAGAPLKLPDRPRLAQEAGASLFVAIHHDSAQLHYLSPWTWQGVSRLYCDRFRGYGLFVSGKNPAFAESQQVAMDIADGFLRSHLHPSLHHAEPIAGENRPLLDAQRGVYQFDDLVVLKKTILPAVLIEAGVIVNREEELALATPDFQQKVVDAIVAATMAHCQRLAAH